MKNVQFALIQLACSNDPVQNFEHTEKAIRQAAIQGAQVICLQELFQSTYFCFEENQDFFK